MRTAMSIAAVVPLLCLAASAGVLKTGTPPAIDGRLDEAVWTKAEWESGEAKPDGTEIVEIGWFTRETLPTIPAPGSIAHKVITQFFNL